jgi:hypothetical protein
MLHLTLLRNRQKTATRSRLVGAGAAIEWSGFRGLASLLRNSFRGEFVWHWPPQPHRHTIPEFASRKASSRAKTDVSEEQIFHVQDNKQTAKGSARTDVQAGARLYRLHAASNDGNPRVTARIIALRKNCLHCHELQGIHTGSVSQHVSCESRRARDCGNIDTARPCLRSRHATERPTQGH